MSVVYDIYIYQSIYNDLCINNFIYIYTVLILSLLFAWHSYHIYNFTIERKMLIIFIDN